MAKKRNGNERDDNYTVGHGKPPKSGQFKKGQSGNPKGRPKESRNLIILLQEELDRWVHVNIDGMPTKMSKRKLMIVQLVNRAAKGDGKAVSKIFDLLEKRKATLEEIYALREEELNEFFDECVIPLVKETILPTVRAMLKELYRLTNKYGDKEGAKFLQGLAEG